MDPLIYYNKTTFSFCIPFAQLFSILFGSTISAMITKFYVWLNRLILKYISFPEYLKSRDIPIKRIIRFSFVFLAMHILTLKFDTVHLTLDKLDILCIKTFHNFTLNNKTWQNKRLSIKDCLDIIHDSNTAQ